MLPTKFQVDLPFGLEEEAKKYFQDGCHLGFLFRRILDIFYQLVALMFPTQFQINWLLVSKERKNRFSRWWPSSIFHRNNFSSFYLEVTLILPTKFQVKWPLGSGEEAKYRFSSWPPGQPSWISSE